MSSRDTLGVFEPQSTVSYEQALPRSLAHLSVPVLAEYLMTFLMEAVDLKYGRWAYLDRVGGTTMRMWTGNDRPTFAHFIIFIGVILYLLAAGKQVEWSVTESPSR